MCDVSTAVVMFIVSGQKKLKDTSVPVLLTVPGTVVEGSLRFVVDTPRMEVPPALGAHNIFSASRDPTEKGFLVLKSWK